MEKQSKCLYWCHICQTRVEICSVEITPICYLCQGEVLERLDEDEQDIIQFQPPVRESISQEQRQARQRNFENTIFHFPYFNNANVHTQFHDMPDNLGRRFTQIIRFVYRNHDKNKPQPTKQEMIDKMIELYLDKNSNEIIDKQSCGICMEDYKIDDKVKITLCKHVFHENCLMHWLKMSNICPFCRFKFIQLIKKINYIK